MLLFGSLIVYLELLPDLFVLNPFSGYSLPFLRGPFGHSNHFAYILMTGALACSFLFISGKTIERLILFFPMILFAIGLYLTSGRGAMLGTVIGSLGMLLIYNRFFARIGVLALIIITGAITGIMFLGSIDHLLNLSTSQAIEIRSFSSLSQLCDEEWFDKVQRGADKLSLYPDKSTTSPYIELAPGSYRIIAHGNIYPFTQEQEDLTNIYPEIVIQISSDDGFITREIVSTTSGVKYIIGPTINLTEPNSLQIELSILDPDIEFDARVYINLDHVLIIPSSTPEWIFNLHNMLQKPTIAYREDIWCAGLQNLKAYGPLGVGAGNAESWPGMGMHNLFMEQYGEGGIITLTGFLGWLILPIINIKKTRLDPDLAWGIVAMMAGLIVHCLFWEQFLNGLRFLTLVYVCLWTALATQKVPTKETADIVSE